MKSIRTSKKIAAIFCTAALMMSMVVTPALAYDQGSTVLEPQSVTDYPVNFNFNLFSWECYTSPEWKEDYSSTYINAYDKNVASCFLEVWGSTAWNGIFTNRTQGGSALLDREGEFLITQFVRESGEGWAKLKGLRNYSDGYLNGLWSADSIGWFPSLN